MRRLLIALLTGILPCAAALAQPPRAVARPQLEGAEPFSRVAEVRELPGGSVLVLDNKENTLQVLSADFEEVKPVSRVGSGPLEYRMILQLVRGRADTTLAYDVMNARFLVVDPVGKPVRVVSLREAAGGMPVGPMQVKGNDPNGRILFQGVKVSMGSTGPVLSDTSYVLRLDPGRKAIDTLTTVRIGSPGMKMSGDVQKGSAQLALALPAFPTVDEWGVMPDGRVLVVRGESYRLEFVSAAGAVVSRGPVPFQRVRVTEADKKKQREAMQGQQQEMQRAMANAAATVPQAQRAQIPKTQLVEPSAWPAYKPPFAAGALRIAPDGEIWVHRLRAASEARALYDVFGPDGSQRGQVEFPARTTLAGLGARVLYAVRTDSDDLQYLQRIERPRW